MIAEAKNLKALCFDYRGARCVGSFSIVGKMLPAIEFDHQSGGMAYEVGDKILDGNLATEAGAVQTMTA